MQLVAGAMISKALRAHQMFPGFTSTVSQTDPNNATSGCLCAYAWNTGPDNAAEGNAGE
jgi:hypothetical protein